MAAINLKPTGPESKLLRYTQIELKDITDAYLESCFAAIQQNRYTMDSNYLLQISQNKKNKEHISHALIYGILIDTTNRDKYYKELLLLNGNNLTSSISILETLIRENWRRIYEHVRQQLFWFLREILITNIDGIDRLYYVFLRQINLHEQSLDLAEQILELLQAHPLFLKTYPEMMLLTIYTYLSIFPIYLKRKSNQTRHIDFILNLTRENLHCIGRDAIRLLVQIGHFREIDAFLKHLSTNISSDYLPKTLALQTEPKYLALPLPFDLEKHLQFLLDNCRINLQEKYFFEWFQTQYLNYHQQFDRIFLCSHIIRYICRVCRDQINTNKIPRWTFIVFILNSLSNFQQTLSMPTAPSNAQLMLVNEQIVQCRLAIYYDWFLFDSNQLQKSPNEFDLQINSTLVGYHLLTLSYAHIKQMLLFLLHTSENFIQGLKEFFQQNISRLFYHFFRKFPNLNSQQLLQMFTHDTEIYQRLLTNFFTPSAASLSSSNISDPDEIMIINDDINPNAMMPNTTDDESNDILIGSENQTTASRFSDDEDDDDEDNRLHVSKSVERPFTTNNNDDDDDDDDDVLLINDDNKLSSDIYNTNIVTKIFPFDRFHGFIPEQLQQLAYTYLNSTNRNKSSILIQIYKKISSILSEKRPLILQNQAIDPSGPIGSYSMSKFEKTSDKFQSRLLTFFDEQTIVIGIYCLWLLRDSFSNRLLPTTRITQNNQINSVNDNNFRDISPVKFKRSAKQVPIYSLFRMIKDDPTNQDIYIKLLQSMFFFQSEVAYIFLYYLSIDIDDIQLAGDIFEKFAKDIIKLSTSFRKAAIPPAKSPTYDQDFIDFMHEILSQCEQDDSETYLYLFSYIYRLYPKRFLNNIKLLRLLLHTINAYELEQYMCDILKHRLQLFYSHKLYSIVDQTLLFNQTEQEDFWKLLSTHDFVQNEYEQLFTNIIEHLLNQSKSVVGEQRLAKSTNYTTYRNTIALDNVFDILKTKLPTYGLVCCLFAHELTKNFSEKLCRLWHEQHHDVFWKHLERILQKWIQRENDQTKQKIDYKIGTIKMANEKGLKYILQHLQILLDNSPMNIPLSKATIKSLGDFIHKDEQLYNENRNFVDRFVSGNSVCVNVTSTTTVSQPQTTAGPVKRRKLEHKS